MLKRLTELMKGRPTEEDPQAARWRREGEAKGRAEALAPFVHPSFMHLPVNVKTAPGRILEVDDHTSPRAREAVRRVVAAYHAAIAESPDLENGLWENIEKSSAKGAFFRGLKKRDHDEVGRWLGRMFQCDLTWGLGKVHESMPANMRENPRDSLIQTRCTDAVVSLAQACGVLPIVSVQHQGFEPLLRELDVNVDEVLRQTEVQLGLNVACPEVGGGYGCTINGRFVSIDSLVHSYTVYRVGQLGMKADSRIAEIGGGDGCLAALMYRAGYRAYEVFDLPWVNVLQGYFLLMTLPPEEVRLFGEGGGSVVLTPCWRFDALAEKSVDCVINTDSLPEMPVVVRENYIRQIHRVLRGVFLSINQESGLKLPGLDPQDAVRPMVDRHGGFVNLARSRSWLVQGYVDEVFAPRR